MTFQGDFQKSGNRARSGGGGGKIAAGGGIGTLVIAGIFLLLGGNPADLGRVLGDSSQQQQLPVGQGQSSGSLDHCKTGADANKYADCRVEFTAISLDRVWDKQLPQQANIQYTKPGITVFDGATRTGCGQASASTGPFYCPKDQTGYFAPSFFSQIDRLGGKNAPFAQEYIVAHEFGHHIQQLEGTLGLSNYNQPGADSNAVKIELQADCYAGVWGHYADKGPDAILEPITEDQVRDAVTAARAVGDDNIQQRSGGDVRPDQFTHGSSEQRQKAFMLGYQSGKMAQCDFLDRGGYR